MVGSDGWAIARRGPSPAAETGLDFFLARYYSSGYGRFLSPDEFTGGPVDAFSPGDPLPPGPLPYADITNPQSLNKYTYVLNNPIYYVDPSGHRNLPSEILESLGIDQGRGCEPGMFLCDDPEKKEEKKSDDPKAPVNPLKGNPVGGVLNWLVDGESVAVAARDLRDAETTLGKVGAGTALILLIGINGIPGGGQAATKGEVVVYKTVKNGKAIYIGITKDLLKREGQHGAKLEKIAGELTRFGARATEQVLIEFYGLAKNGGQLLNKINSIARKHPYYEKAVEYGKKMLESVNYQP